MPGASPRPRGATRRSCPKRTGQAGRGAPRLGYGARGRGGTRGTRSGRGGPRGGSRRGDPRGRRGGAERGGLREGPGPEGR